MKQLELTAARRTATGKSAARHLRRQGLTPAILYGRGLEPVPLAVNVRALRDLLRAAGHTAIVRLNIEDGADEAPTVIVREIQRDPLSGAVLNVDFQRVSLTEKVTAMVPVTLVGEAPGVKRGGVLEQHLREVEAEALPTELPDHLELDVSGLQLGQSLHVGDLRPPTGVTITSEPADVIVSLTAPRVTEEAPAPAAPPEAEAPAAKEETSAEGEAA